VEDYKSTVLTDDAAKKLLLQCIKLDSPFKLQTMEKGERDSLIRKIKSITKISTHQIARLTGISQSVIARA
jgi:hypothetical protein